MQLEDKDPFLHYAYEKDSTNDLDVECLSIIQGWGCRSTRL